MGVEGVARPGLVAPKDAKKCARSPRWGWP